MDLLAVSHGLSPLLERAEPAAARPAGERNWEAMLKHGRTPEAPEEKREFMRYLCRQLESVAVGCLMRAARRTVPGDGLLSGGFAGSMYQGLADENYARMIAEGGGFGVGDAIFRQLTGQKAYARAASAEPSVQATAGPWLTYDNPPGSSAAAPQGAPGSSDN